MRRVLIVGLIAVGVIVVGSCATAWWLLRGSLPQLDGRASLAEGGPRAEVTIERDADGIATVRGTDHHDVAYGLGYAHAQDRFFQMDLARRLAAGELWVCSARVLSNRTSAPVFSACARWQDA